MKVADTGYAALLGLETILANVFYKHVAPMALKNREFYPSKMI